MRHLNYFNIFEQKKTFPKIKSNVLMPLNNYNKQILIQTNQTILKKLKESDYQLPEGYVNPSNPNFLSRVSAWLENKGVTPYLNINTGDAGRDESVSMGVSWVIPKTNISVNLQNGYFGLDIPLPKGINLGLGYQSGDKEDIVGGYRDKVGGGMIGNSKFGVKLTIPIGE
jgi:hypothetical protein